MCLLSCLRVGYIEQQTKLGYNIAVIEEGIMANSTTNKTPKNTRIFTPKMSNFEMSSRYEGLSTKKENVGKSINDLKLKYAR
jgi:hypothetical protein